MVSFAPTGFTSFSEYWRFAWAREFRDIDTHERIEYAKTRLEQLGDILVYPTMRISDHAMRNIRNPLMILTVTLTAILAVTILFYPEQLMRGIARALPMAEQVKPWMIKAALYTALQGMIVGICLRTLGRLDPSGELWDLWDQSPREIVTVSIGTVIVQDDEE
jgi:hypothetical protein